VRLATLDAERLRRLLDAGRSLVARLELEAVLDELLEVARELTGARYAAIGVLDEDRRALERFLVKGIDQAGHRAIGELPRGRGILGALIDDPRPLRLHRVGDDARSYGFPAGHPPMDTFLGVPVLIRGEAWGNLYLTEKAGGEDFTEADEETVVVLADWAAIAIDNARLYEGVEARRDALERAVLSLEATTDIARAVGGETDLDRILELIVKRGRALVEARAVVIVLREEDLVVAAGAGQADPRARGTRLTLRPGPFDAVLRRQQPERIADLPRRLGGAWPEMGVGEPQTALLVPLVFRGRALGVLCAFDRLADEPTFDDEHERLLQAFAASAATAVATARTVADERLRHSLRAAEEERRRWARELHDETLQGMGGLRVMLSSALRQDDPEALRRTVREAVDRLGGDIDGLRSLITALRPATLDELGLAPALRALLARVRATHDVALDAEVDLADDDGRASTRLGPEIETAVFRLVQEALTNVVRHSGARRVRVLVIEGEGRIDVEVSDDGHGFDPDDGTPGFGLVGMRERVGLVSGTLDISSSPDGTVVRATVPVRRAA
jgi:signal transduction histidine kinase